MKLSESNRSTRRAPAPNDSREVATGPLAPAQALCEERAQEAAPSLEAQAKHELIAVAAYYLAERRGFAPGGEFDDWLRAEAEIEASLQSAVPEERKEGREEATCGQPM